MVAPQHCNSGSHNSFFAVVLVLLCVASQIAGRNATGDVFSSPDALVELYRTENIVMGELKKFIREMDIEHDYLER